MSVNSYGIIKQHSPVHFSLLFCSFQVMADPRMRVEQRIREAGLQNSEYARQVMQQIQPPRPARRDMESTLFK